MANILVESIPVDWALSTGWTRSFSSGPLTEKFAKRPLIPADKAAEAPNLHTLLAGENPLTNPIGYCGYLTSMDSPIAIIDVDAPKDLKAFLKQSYKLVSQNKTTLEDHISLVQERLIQTLPKPVQDLIPRTYTELSASGAGVHIVIKMDKSSLDKGAYKKPVDFLGQLSITNNYMVTTGNKLPESAPGITEVPFAILDILFNLTGTYSDALSGPNSSGALAQLAPLTPMDELLEADVVPSLEEIQRALHILPLNQSDRIKAVYKRVFEAEYEHYTYWVQIGMALHSWASQTKELVNGLALYVQWSATDPEAFESDEAVAAKWESFHTIRTPDGAQAGLTFKTIFKLAKAFEFAYPRPIFVKGKRTIQPDKCEYVNFKYLMDKYCLKLLLIDGDHIYIKGDEDILDRYFMMHGVNKWFGMYGPLDLIQLQTATWKLCQDSLWRGLSNTVNFVQAWSNEPMEEIDLFHIWLDTPFDELPEDLKYILQPDGSKVLASRYDEQSTFEHLESCIHWSAGQDIDLCRRQLYLTFMQLIKFHEPIEFTFEDNGGMLAFIGPENSYKTTFFKSLLPRPLALLRKDINQELGGEKNKRDFVRYLSTKTIVLVDEFEGFMDNKKSGAFFKAIISGNSMSFTDIYQTKERALRRRAILVGTSNEQRQVLSDNGSRRLWLCQVNHINTTKLLQMNLHTLYRSLRAEFRQQKDRGETPWLMSLAETRKTTMQNVQLKAQSSIDMDLEEVFPYYSTYNVEANIADREKLLPSKKNLGAANILKDESSRFLKTIQVSKILEMNGVKAPSTAELSRALERFCKKFIGQTKPVIELTKGRAIINGRLCLNKRATGQYNHKFWIMPTEEDLDVNLDNYGGDDLD